MIGWHLDGRGYLNYLSMIIYPASGAGVASAVFSPSPVQVGGARNRKNVGVAQLQRGVLFFTAV